MNKQIIVDLFVGGLLAFMTLAGAKASLIASQAGVQIDGVSMVLWLVMSGTSLMAIVTKSKTYAIVGLLSIGAVIARNRDLLSHHNMITSYSYALIITFITVLYLSWLLRKSTPHQE